MLIQVGSLTDAVQDPLLQPLGLAVTVNEVKPPVAATFCSDVGLAEKVHVDGGAATWLIVTFCPAMATVPDRGLGVPFAR